MGADGSFLSGSDTFNITSDNNVVRDNIGAGIFNIDGQDNTAVGGDGSTDSVTLSAHGSTAFGGISRGAFDVMGANNVANEGGRDDVIQWAAQITLPAVMLATAP